jgi:ABC-type phosphate transport system substrate-binding protein
MLTMIYSGSALNWQDFGVWYQGAVPTTGADPIIACVRHAGSGTAATFHIMMKGNGWGVPEAAFPTAQSTGGPNYQFSDGTADMMKCVAGYDLTHTLGQNIGAIGYADCDVLMATPFSNPTSGTLNYPYELVHQLKLDGIECKAAKVRDGEYPFYTIEWMYYDPTNTEASLISDLATFAGNGLNYASIAFTNGPNSQGSEGDFWDSEGEMNYLKSSDFSWPTIVGGNGDRLP